tara:strand:- start:2445 stop:4034 length:1590 start_codon:yes stop_codon:yes gene_type:complete
MPNFSGKWSQNQILYNDLGFYRVPGAPTSVSATSANAQSVVSFTAPTYAGLPATITGYRVRATVQAGRTIPVTVVNAGSGNKYNMDGSAQPTLTLIEGYTYTFDQANSSNSGHPLRFSTTSNGTHGGGSEYTTGVTVVGTPGSAGAYTRIVVAAGAPTLYYYCTVHSGMGGTANTSTFNVEVTGSASPLTITGLTNFTTYNIEVQAQNAGGYGDAGTTTAAPIPPNQIAYTTAGTYSFIVPSNLSPATISAVGVGGGGSGMGNTNTSNNHGGGGGGAALAYVNNLSVTAGQTWTISIPAGGVSAGNQSSNAGGACVLTNPSSSVVLQANGGAGGIYSNSTRSAGGTVAAGTGGSGGQGGAGNGNSGPNYYTGGGGGAGGYAGTGGNGANAAGGATAGFAGSGGGAGGAGAPYGLFGGSSGGGTGLYGQGNSGNAGASSGTGGGGAGSPEPSGVVGAQGTNGSWSLGNSPYDPSKGASGGLPGGGGGGGCPATNNGGNHFGGDGGTGAMRIIYSFAGTTRAFPSTNTGDL